MKFADPPDVDYARILRAAGWHVYVEKNIEIDMAHTKRWLILRASKGDCRVKLTAASDSDQTAWQELFESVKEFEPDLDIGENV